MNRTLELLGGAQHEAQPADAQVLVLANDADPLTAPLDGITRIDLHFPKFSDGRAYSQAAMLRRRRGFTGDIRATGDVLVDQLVQMQRTGFTSAVLRSDQDLSHVEPQFARFPGYYQGDTQQAMPLFRKAA
ncbi:DUF934 domain-containing protein [Ramlibacter rhizophilus]|uniref:DUF934 domain-containing protein n=1 Tax=Ramlibacter rhizophilus TaxID=1781167 RepID=A0A4Z0BYI2_9BURK|nr:DUF934 domain-containing protein [Ramlibacter rhizophilus]TFZ03358.1 DUF934 domain-containing protein [Ramlibacter rhizophilus]